MTKARSANEPDYLPADKEF